MHIEGETSACFKRMMLFSFVSVILTNYTLIISEHLILWHFVQRNLSLANAKELEKCVMWCTCCIQYIIIRQKNHALYPHWLFCSFFLWRWFCAFENSWVVKSDVYPCTVSNLWIQWTAVLGSRREGLPLGRAAFWQNRGLHILFT